MRVYEGWEDECEMMKRGKCARDDDWMVLGWGWRVQGMMVSMVTGTVRVFQVKG